ncbi:MAG: histidine kinase [Chitinophagaceae bacterium]
MKRKPNKQQLRLYALTGLGFLLLNMLHMYNRYQDALLQRLINGVWSISYLAVINYFFLEYIWPVFTRKRMIRFILLLPVAVFLYSLGFYTWRLIGTGLHIYMVFETFPSVGKAVADRMEFAMESLFFFALIRHLYNYTRLQQVSQQLRIEKQQAELNYLKSQTNPHFLFNTLNNIYALAREKSELAPESILRLSKMLRYMLYETTGRFIAIEQELKVISDYIELEKLRYDDSLQVNFNHTIDELKQSIPPLLLIPLVENAFKHGISETRNRPFIDLHLSVKKQQLVMLIRNSTDDAAPGQTIRENIGLSNLRRQLELLYTDYTLSLQQESSVFIASLQINLASHAGH